MLGERRLVLWIPDWPLAAVTAQVPPGSPAATVRNGRIISTTRTARSWGIRAGMKQQVAMQVCDSLIVLTHDVERDNTAFEAVLQLLDQHLPQVQALRAGLAWATIGTHEWKREEEDLLAAISEDISLTFGIEAFLGIGSGVATAMCSARRGQIVPVANTEEFLSGLQLSEIVSFLPRKEKEQLHEVLTTLDSLGIRLVKDLWQLGHRHVLSRFGQLGQALWSLSTGGDWASFSGKTPEIPVGHEIRFEEPAAELAPVVFAIKSGVEDFMDEVASRGLTLREVSVTLIFADGQSRLRKWLFFGEANAGEVFTRVSWQIRSWSDSVALDPSQSPHLLAGIALTATNAATADDTGLLWRSASRRGNINRTITQIQMKMGTKVPLQPHVREGMTPRERVVLLPWGQSLSDDMDIGEWAGKIQEAPPILFDTPVPIRLLGQNEEKTWGPLWVSNRGILNGDPRRVLIVEDTEILPAGPYDVTDVGAVWTHLGQWWRAGMPPQAFIRVSVSGAGDLLLVQTEGNWFIEGIYAREEHEIR